MVALPPPSSTGLKSQMGVGNPNSGMPTAPSANGNPNAGSDQQAQAFQAAFQALQGTINEHLQYTAVNAEASKHAGVAGQRDGLFSTFQGVLSQIDPTDPSKAASAIQAALAQATTLSGQATTFRQEAEKAKNDWDSRQGQFDQSVQQIEELEAWEDPKAGALRSQADAIRGQTNERQYGEACSTMDGLPSTLAPVYEEYQKQKAAQPQYEQMASEAQAQHEALAAAERPSSAMTAKAAEITGAIAQAAEKAGIKDFLAGLDMVQTLRKVVEELQQLTNDPERLKFLANVGTLDQIVQAPSGTPFKSQEAEWAAIIAAKEQVAPAGDAGDYAAANSSMGELTSKVEAFKAKQAELEQQKTEYETAVTQFQQRLDGLPMSEPQYAKLAPMLEELRGGQTQMESSAQAEEYGQAVSQAQELSAKADALEQAKAEIDAKKQEYEAALAAIQPRLADASVSDPAYTKLEPQVAELAQAQSTMEAAAEAGDFDQAKTQLDDLSGKLDALEQAKAEIDAKKQEYETALAALQPRLADTAVSDPAYAKLEPLVAGLSQAQSDMEASAQDGDYEQAKTQLDDLSGKLDEFETAKADIDAKKQEYETALAGLQSRLTAVSTSDPKYVSLEPMESELATMQAEMESAATEGDYDNALQLLQKLSSKVDEVEQARADIDQKQQEYEAGLAAVQSRLGAASVSDPQYTELDPMVAELATAQTEMEAAAQGGDYDNALNLLQELTANLDALEKAKADLDQKRKDGFNAAWDPVKAKVADALLSSRAFSALSAERTALEAAKGAVEAQAEAGKYDEATKLIPDANTKADAYLAAAKVKEEEVKKQADVITSQLDGASDATRADVAKNAAKALTEEQVKALPTDVRNRLLTEMQKDGIDDDEKAAMKNLFSQKYLDPKFEKLDDETRQKLIEKMKQDPDFKKARDNWATISEAERVAVLKKAADYQAEAYGITKTDVEAYSPKNPDGTLRRQRMGEYSDSEGKLKISREAMQDKGFDTVMDTVMHENGHRYQSELLKKLDSTPPGLKPGDPEYDQAMTFKLNDKYYIQPKVKSTDAPTPDTGDEYFTQPMESHSRRTGEGVAAAGIGK